MGYVAKEVQVLQVPVPLAPGAWDAVRNLPLFLWVASSTSPRLTSYEHRELLLSQWFHQKSQNVPWETRL